MENKSLHICFVSPEFPNQRLLPAAGIGFSILNLATALVAQNHRVTVVVYRQKNELEFTENGIRVIAFAATKNPFYSRFYWRIDLARRVKSLHDKEVFDVIEVPDYEGSSAFFDDSLPTMVKLHGSLSYFDFLAQQKPKLSYFFYEKKALKRAKYILSVSNFAAETTKAVFKLNFNYSVVYNGVTAEVNQHPESSNIVFYFGSLIEKKGFLEMPAIFEIVAQKKPEVEFWFAGKDFATRNKKSTKELFFKILKPKYHNQVKDFGVLTPTELKATLAKATVCVFPSFAEALPMAWLEAMAFGKAIVASNIGWSTELLENQESALLCHPKEHAVFAENILTFLNNQDLRKSYGLKAQQLVQEKFVLEKVVNLHVDLYKQFRK